VAKKVKLTFKRVGYNSSSPAYRLVQLIGAATIGSDKDAIRIGNAVSEAEVAKFARHFLYEVTVKV